MLSVGNSRGSSLKLVRTATRTVIIPVDRRSRARRRRVKTTSDEKGLDLDTIDFRNEKEVQFKINQLKEFTKSLRRQVHYVDELKRKQTIEQEEVAGKVKEDADFDDAAGLILSTFERKRNVGEIAEQRGAQDLSSLLLSTTDNEPLLPPVLAERVQDEDLILRSLFDKRSQDFNPIISKLYHSEERLKGIDPDVVYKSFLRIRNKKYTLEALLHLDEMVMESINGDVDKLRGDYYEHLMRHISHCKSDSQKVKLAICATLKGLLERLDGAIKKNKFPPSQFILNSCVLAAHKAKDWKYMEYFMKKFVKDYGIQPNRENYSTVISFYTSMNHYQKAWELFDSLKFLSLEHRPDTKVYNLMFAVCQKEKNFARVLDLLHEMDDLKVEKDVVTFLNAAKSLAMSTSDNVISEGKAQSLRLEGWKLIHKLHEDPKLAEQLVSNPHNNLMLLETTMVLAAYDGDVSLARASYYKYTCAKYKFNYHEFMKYHNEKDSVNYAQIWERSLSPIMLNWLLLAYSKFNKSHLPLLMGYPEGSRLRNSILYSVDYQANNELMKPYRFHIPMLPYIELLDPNLVLIESKALWRFNAEYGGIYDMKELPPGLESIEELEELISSANDISDFKLRISELISQWKSRYVNHTVLNIRNLVTFLSIPIRLYEPTDFKLRLQEFTFQPFEFNERVESMYKGEKTRKLQAHAATEAINETDDAVSTGVKNYDLPEFLLYVASMKHKLPATDVIYDICMKAAITFHDHDLATNTWKDRGRYRNTESFQKLSFSKKITNDATFAQLMVEYFTSEKMYQDALAIVFSSMKTVDWKYYMIKPLYKALLDIEDQTSAHELLKIVNKKSKLTHLEEEIRNLDI